MSWIRSAAAALAIGALALQVDEASAQAPRAGDARDSLAACHSPSAQSARSGSEATLRAPDKDNRGPVRNTAVDIPDHEVVGGGAQFRYTLPEDAFTDPDVQEGKADSLCFEATGLPSWMAFKPSSRMFYGTPLRRHIAADAPVEITITARDYAGEQATDTFTVTVVGNEPPVAPTVPAVVEVAEGKTFSFPIPDAADYGLRHPDAPERPGLTGVVRLDPPIEYFSDPDGDTLTYRLHSKPDWVIYNADERKIVGKPSASDIASTTVNGNGYAEVAVIASDGSSYAEWTLLLRLPSTEPETPVVANREPDLDNPIADHTFTEAGGTTYAIPANAFSDPDGDPLNIRIPSLPPWLSYDAATGTITADWPTYYAFSGTRRNNVGGRGGNPSQLVAIAEDPSMERIFDFFTISMLVENSGPARGYLIEDQTAHATVPFRFPVPSRAFQDVDGDPNGRGLVYSADESVDWLGFDGVEFYGTPAESDIGVAIPPITVVATDSLGRSASSEFELSVAKAPKREPRHVLLETAGSGDYSVTAGSDANANGAFDYFDNVATDHLVMRSLTQRNNGKLVWKSVSTEDVASGDWAWQDSVYGTASVGLQADDKTRWKYVLRGDDPDVVAIPEGETRYETLQFRIKDTEDRTRNSKWLSITVSIHKPEANSPPVAGLDPVVPRAFHRSSAESTVSAYDWELPEGLFADPDGDELEYSVSPDWLRVDTLPLGEKAIRGERRTDDDVPRASTITITATDPHGAAASRALDWQVNYAPTGVNDEYSFLVSASETVVGNVLDNDSDREGDTVSVGAYWSYVDGSRSATCPINQDGCFVEGEHGSLKLSADGVATYRPKAATSELASNEVDRFGYDLRDSSGGETLNVGITLSIDQPPCIASTSSVELPDVFESSDDWQFPRAGKKWTYSIEIPDDCSTYGFSRLPAWLTEDRSVEGRLSVSGVAPAGAGQTLFDFDLTATGSGNSVASRRIDMFVVPSITESPNADKSVSNRNDNLTASGSLEFVANNFEDVIVYGNNRRSAPNDGSDPVDSSEFDNSPEWIGHIETLIASGNERYGTNYPYKAGWPSTWVDDNAIFADTTSRYSTGTYGILRHDPSGEWLYVLDREDPDTRALQPGSSVQESFAIAVRWANGGNPPFKRHDPFYSSNPLIITIDIAIDSNRPPVAGSDPVSPWVFKRYGRHSSVSPYVWNLPDDLFSDPDDDELTYSVTPDWLRVETLHSGRKAVRGERAVDDSLPSGSIMTITATDPYGLSASREFSWAVNYHPTTVHDEFSLAASSRRGTVVGNVLDNDSDRDGDTLSVWHYFVYGGVRQAYCLTSDAGCSVRGDYGELAVAAGGEATYTPFATTADLVGDAVDEFRYMVEDSFGSRTGFVRIRINLTVPENNPPVASSESFTPRAFHRSSAESTVSAYDWELPEGLFVDPDGDELEYSVSPDWLRVDTLPLGEKAIRGERQTDDDVPRASTITITATDPHGATASRVLDWLVNYSPTGANDEFPFIASASEAVIGSVLDNDSDRDGDSLSVGLYWSYVGGARQASCLTSDAECSVRGDFGEMTISTNGEATYSPFATTANLTNDAVDRFGYNLGDSAGGSTSNVGIAVNLTVPENNRPPINSNKYTSIRPLTLSSRAKEIDYHSTLENTFSDPDGDELTYSITPNWFDVKGTIYNSRPVLAIDATDVPLEMYPDNRIIEVTITATDPHGASASRKFDMKASYFPEPRHDDFYISVPIASNDEIPLGNVLDNDYDKDDDPLNVYRYFFGSSSRDRFQVTTYYSSHGVVRKNEPRYLEGEYGELKVTSGGEVTYRPNKDIVNEVRTTVIDRFEYNLVDGITPSTYPGEINIHLVGENQPPFRQGYIARNPTYVDLSDEIETIRITSQGSLYPAPEGINFPPLFVDPDGDELTYSVSGLPQWIEYEFSTVTEGWFGGHSETYPVLNLFPNRNPVPENANRHHIITITASDGKGGSASATLNLYTNRLPEIENRSLKVDSKIFSTNLLDGVVDPDGDEMSLRPKTANGRYGQLVVDASGVVTYTINSDISSRYDTKDIFYISYRDDFTPLSKLFRLSLDVSKFAEPENTPPIADNDRMSISVTASGYREGTMNVIDNDIDPEGGALTVERFWLLNIDSSRGLEFAAGENMTNVIGSFTLAANGDATFSGTHLFAAMKAGAWRFEYEVSDPHGATATAIVGFPETSPPVNTAPTAVDRTLVIGADPLAAEAGLAAKAVNIFTGAAVSVSANHNSAYVPNPAIDPDGDNLHVSRFAYGTDIGMGAVVSCTHAQHCDVTSNVVANRRSVVAGQYGNLVMWDAGAAIYYPNTASLAPGQYTDTFVFEITDTLASDTATLTVTLEKPVPNRPPVALADRMQTNAVASGYEEGTMNVLDNDIDPESELLTVKRFWLLEIDSSRGLELTAGESMTNVIGSFTLAANGVATFSGTHLFAAMKAGAWRFEYEVSDPHGATATAIVGFPETSPPVNTAPTAVDRTLMIGTDLAAKAVNLFTGAEMSVSGDHNSAYEPYPDIDPDGDNLHVSKFAAGTDIETGGVDTCTHAQHCDIASNVAANRRSVVTGSYGTLVVWDTGAAIYNPNAASLAPGQYTDTFVFKITDTLASDTATLTVTMEVIAPNRAPVSNAEITRPEAFNINGNANSRVSFYSWNIDQSSGSLFTDPDGDSLSYSVSTPDWLEIKTYERGDGSNYHLVSGRISLEDLLAKHSPLSMNSMTIVATDSRGASTTRTFDNWKFNYDPTAVDDELSLVARIEKSVSENVLENDYDLDCHEPDGSGPGCQSISVGSIRSMDGGSPYHYYSAHLKVPGKYGYLIVRSNGDAKYELTAEDLSASVSERFSYDIADRHDFDDDGWNRGRSESAIITVNISVPENYLPNAESDILVLSSVPNINVLDNDWDFDDDSLSVTRYWSVDDSNRRGPEFTAGNRIFGLEGSFVISAEGRAHFRQTPGVSFGDIKFEYEVSDGTATTTAYVTVSESVKAGENALTHLPTLQHWRWDYPYEGLPWTYGIAGESLDKMFAGADSYRFANYPSWLSVATFTGKEIGLRGTPPIGASEEGLSLDIVATGSDGVSSTLNVAIDILPRFTGSTTPTWDSENNIVKGMFNRESFTSDPDWRLSLNMSYVEGEEAIALPNNQDWIRRVENNEVYGTEGWKRPVFYGVNTSDKVWYKGAYGSINVKNTGEWNYKLTDEATSFTPGAVDTFTLFIYDDQTDLDYDQAAWMARRVYSNPVILRIRHDDFNSPDPNEPESQRSPVREAVAEATMDAAWNRLDDIGQEGGAGDGEGLPFLLRRALSGMETRATWQLSDAYSHRSGFSSEASRVDFEGLSFAEGGLEMPEMPWRFWLSEGQGETGLVGATGISEAATLGFERSLDENFSFGVMVSRNDSEMLMPEGEFSQRQWTVGPYWRHARDDVRTWGTAGFGSSDIKFDADTFESDVYNVGVGAETVLARFGVVETKGRVEGVSAAAEVDRVGRVAVAGLRSDIELGVPVEMERGNARTYLTAGRHWESIDSMREGAVYGAGLAIDLEAGIIAEVSTKYAGGEIFYGLDGKWTDDRGVQASVGFDDTNAGSSAVFVEMGQETASGRDTRRVRKLRLEGTNGAMERVEVGATGHFGDNAVGGTVGRSVGGISRLGLDVELRF